MRHKRFQKYSTNVNLDTKIDLNTKIVLWCSVTSESDYNKTCGSYQKSTPSLILQHIKDSTKISRQSQEIASVCVTQFISQIICWFISTEFDVQLIEMCLKCPFSVPAFANTVDITGLPVQSLTTMSTSHKFFLFCLCLSLRLPLSLLSVFSSPIFSFRLAW